MVNGSIYRLMSCPTGYVVISVGADGEFDGLVRECRACGRGEECTLGSCRDCSVCKPGYLKVREGVEACLACPVNTYRVDAGAAEEADCLGCPDWSTTEGRVGESSVAGCICDGGFYRAVSRENGTEKVSCVSCPIGGLCSDGVCGLRDGLNLSCSDGRSVVGSWVRDSNTSHFLVASCPSGYELLSTKETGCKELQECKKCGKESEYILSPDRDECQACPPGLDGFEGEGQGDVFYIGRSEGAHAMAYTGDRSQYTCSESGWH